MESTRDGDRLPRSHVSNAAITSLIGPAGNVEPERRVLLCGGGAHQSVDDRQAGIQGAVNDLEPAIADALGRGVRREA